PRLATPSRRPAGPQADRRRAPHPRPHRALPRARLLRLRGDELPGAARLRLTAEGGPPAAERAPEPAGDEEERRAPRDPARRAVSARRRGHGDAARRPPPRRVHGHPGLPLPRPAEVPPLRAGHRRLGELAAAAP